MQNPMAAMAAMSQNGPIDGTPIMGNGQRRPQPNNINDPRDQLNTYIYDYFIRNQHHRLARMMIECELKMNLNPANKASPGGRGVNGVDGMDQDSKDDMPIPKIPPGQATENSFLLDWWVQFWDIFSAARGHSTKGLPYIAHARTLTQVQTDQRNQRMMMTGGMGANYQNMIRQMPNGVAPNDLKRAAVMNNRNPNANPMANMNQMKNPAMMPTQMQRDGSQVDMNGQRPQSPSSNENAPSPNKRPRVDGGMNPGNVPNAQFGDGFPTAQGVQQKQIEGINSGVQGASMNQQSLDGQHDMFAGNPPRGLPAGPPGAPQGNHALQDYQMQLMLLEQQNKKRLLMARQEQDSMSGPHAQTAVGAPGFPPSMSPQGSRAGPSPNPTDQMKKGTPRMGQQGLPGSPMPEGAMQQQRNSPTPNLPFDHSNMPNNMPPGMHPQYGFPGQMPQTPMMRPPSSHPGGFQPGQQLTPGQMEQIQRTGGMPNGVWRGQPVQPGMIPNQQQMGPMGGNPQQRQMPPPPAPTSEQPRAQEPSPSQPAQAPPTPSTTNKKPPAKKNTKDAKAATNKKGPNAGATPAASGGEEPPTPTSSTPMAPITPMNPKSFGQAGQPQAPTQPQPAAAQQQQPPPMNANGPPFGSLADDTDFMDSNTFNFDDNNTLENFDFDSFLHVNEDQNFGLGDGLGDGFGFDPVEAGGDL